jgi:hypothetical protein
LLGNQTLGIVTRDGNDGREVLNLRDGNDGREVLQDDLLALLQHVGNFFNLEGATTVGFVGIVDEPLEQGLWNFIKELFAAECNCRSVEEGVERPGVSRTVGAQEAHRRRLHRGNRLHNSVGKSQTTYKFRMYSALNYET